MPPRRGRFKTCPIDSWSSCRPALHAWTFVYHSSHPLGIVCRTKGCCRESRPRCLESCSFLDQLPPRLPPRPSTNPSFTSFLTRTPIMLTKELLQFPDAPSLLAQRCKLWRELLEHHHLRFVTVCELRMICIPTASYLYCQKKKTLRGLAHALSESSSKRTLGSQEVSLGQKDKSGCPSVRPFVRPFVRSSVRPSGS